FLVGYIYFFFQAEDGIRDFHVTGVQTCALPILIAEQLTHNAGGFFYWPSCCYFRARLFSSPMFHKFFIKKSILMLSAVAAGLGANAKVAVGPEVGLSLSNLKIEYPNTAFRNRMSTGLRAGFAASIEAGRSFSVHTGLYYQNKGSNIVLGVANSYFASHFVVHALQVPVYLTLQ